ncbi:MAG: L-seryl-tRNA(Sec) selenium transferase [Deltaproteobacteria bacterium RBG_13_49_15]|nr:MAG: L-seryl-tRNA(Sec) selenium transferase [Deltaproteobacteria bacterium RBG_13_49_15]
MEITKRQQELLRMLPGVDRIFEVTKTDPFLSDIPKPLAVSSIRAVIETLRTHIIEHESGVSEENLSEAAVSEALKKNLIEKLKPKLLRVVNATGVVIHTNLGRSLLAAAAIKNLIAIGSGYSNLEFDLLKGIRGSRHSIVEDLLCELSGGEAAMVVNNNAGAVLLCLETIASGKKVIVSRGELVEIGGAFRIPDVMAKSGAILKEVGTTNRTHPFDYEKAIENDTALLLKVHLSNFSVVGFTASVDLKTLVELGKIYHLPVMEDLGSGTFIDFSKYGLPKEPTIQESVAAGADVITFSGDKLLGGPQAGIIVGKKETLDRIKKNPVARALRIDKFTLAALESTLSLYRNEENAVSAIPTLRMLTTPVKQIEKRAKRLLAILRNLNNSRLTVTLIDLSSRVGGGALPLLNLPSKCIGVEVSDMSANAVDRFMRGYATPVIGRIENDLFILDMRTVQEDEAAVIKSAMLDMLNRS